MPLRFLLINITIGKGYKTGLSEKCVILIEYLITKQRFISACRLVFNTNYNYNSGI